MNSGTTTQVAFLSYIAICIFYPFYWVIFVAILDSLRRFKCSKNFQLILIPFIWVFLENLRDFGPLAAPWLNLPLSQTGYDRLIQVVSIHVDLSTLLIILFNVLFYSFFNSKEKKYLYGF